MVKFFAVNPVVVVGGNPMRRGISLLEVLISMFVLLIGLAGIASLLPAGRSEIMQGVKLDYAMMIGRNALREFRTRGYVNPRRWVSVDTSGNGSYSTWDAADTTGKPFVLPNVAGSNRRTLAVMVDPLGLKFPSGSFGSTFPTGATLGGLSLVRVGIDRLDSNTYAIADNIFRCADDLILAPNTVDKKAPPIQQQLGNQRGSNGNYSWFATVVPNATSPATGSRVTVSIAVVYKRNLSDPALSEDSPKIVAMPVPIPPPGEPRQPSYGEAVVYDSRKPIKPGQWVMIAGYDNSSGTALPDFKWCKVVQASNQVRVQDWTGIALASGLTATKMVQGVSLSVPDWTLFPNAGSALTISNPMPWPTLFIVDNVIAVYEMSIEQN